jgi:hypothetical protein
MDTQFLGYELPHPCILFLGEGGRNSPSRSLGRLNVDISRSLTVRQTRPVVLPYTSDQLVTEAATCTQHTTSTRDERTPMPSAGFELAIPAISGIRPHGDLDTADNLGTVPAIAWCSA